MLRIYRLRFLLFAAAFGAGLSSLVQASPAADVHRQQRAEIHRAAPHVAGTALPAVGPSLAAPLVESGGRSGGPRTPRDPRVITAATATHSPDVCLNACVECAQRLVRGGVDAASLGTPPPQP